MVKKPPASAGDTGSVPGPGRPVQPKVNKSLKKKKKKKPWQGWGTSVN